MTTNHGTLIVEVRATLPLDGGVKCRHPERVEDRRNRSIATTLKTHISSLGCLNISMSYGLGKLWGNGPKKVESE